MTSYSMLCSLCTPFYLRPYMHWSTGRLLCTADAAKSRGLWPWSTPASWPGTACLVVTTWLTCCSLPLNTTLFTSSVHQLVPQSTHRKWRCGCHQVARSPPWTSLQSALYCFCSRSLFAPLLGPLGPNACECPCPSGSPLFTHGGNIFSYTGKLVSCASVFSPLDRILMPSAREVYLLCACPLPSASGTHSALCNALLAPWGDCIHRCGHGPPV